MQLNSAYFRPGALALTTFKRHNPNYELQVTDYGLSDTERGWLTGCASVIRGPQYSASHRFSHVSARLEAMQALEADDGWTLFLDADTVTMQSIASWEEQVLHSGRDISLVREEPQFKLSDQVHSDAIKYFPLIADAVRAVSYNWGVILVRRTRSAVTILKDLADQYFSMLSRHPEDIALFVFHEQTFGNCYFAANHTAICEGDARYNAFVRSSACWASNGAYYFGEDLAHIVHFIDGRFLTGEKADPDPSSVFGLYRLLLGTVKL